MWCTWILQCNEIWWTSVLWQELERALSADLVEGLGEVNMSDAHGHVLFKTMPTVDYSVRKHTVTQDRQFLPACESGSRWTAQRLCRQSSEGRCHCSFRSHLNRVFYVEREDRGVPYIPQYFTFLPALAQDLMQSEEERNIAILLWDWETSRCLGSFLKLSPSIALFSSSRWGNSVLSGEEVGVGFHPSL